jgi:hypothetical protein
MVALKLIAFVAFGVLFLSISFTLYSQYQRAEAERSFLRQTGRLVELVNELGDQDVGASQIFSITVPTGSQLLFENDRVVAKIGEKLENFPVEVPVSGNALSEGSFQLELLRTRGGVEVQ